MSVDETIILIRPAANQQGWEAYESDQVRPFFAQRGDAISYARSRSGGKRGVIRVFNADDDLELTIPFDERFRRD